MVLLGALIAWSVKEVWIKEVNDSFYVAMCIYTIIIVGGLGNTIGFLIPDKDISLLTAYVSSWLCVTVCLLFLFFPKMYQVWVNRDNDDVDLSHVMDRVNVFDIDMATMTQSMFDRSGRHELDDSDGCVECGKEGGTEEEQSIMDTTNTTDIKTSFLSRFTTRLKGAVGTKSSRSSTEHRPGCSRYNEHGTGTRARSGSRSGGGSGSRFARQQNDVNDGGESIQQSQQVNKGSIYDFDNDADGDDAFVGRSFHELESANTFASSVDGGAGGMNAVQVTIDENEPANRGSVVGNNMGGEGRRSIAAIAEFQDDELGTILLRTNSKAKPTAKAKSSLLSRSGLRRRRKKKKKTGGFVGSLNESPAESVSSSRGRGGKPVTNPLFRTRGRTMSAGL
jgi:hypothetical protein